MSEHRISVTAAQANSLQHMMRAAEAAQAQLQTYLRAVCEAEGIEEATLHAVTLSPPEVVLLVPDRESS